MLTDYLSGSCHLSGYILLYFAVLIEGPVATFAGAALSSAGALRPGYAFLAILAGNMTADAAWYFIGYAGRFASLGKQLPGLHRFNAKAGMVLGEIERNPAKVLFTCKLWFGVAAIPALLAAGIARIKWRQLLPIMICCEILWSGTLFSLGHFLACSLPVLTRRLHEFSFVAAVLFIVVVVTFFCHTFLQKEKTQPK